MKEEGFIYVIRSSAGFKIGNATNYKSRYTNISVASTLELDLVKVYRVEEPLKMEKKYTKYFIKSILGGEWFDLTESDVDLINGFIRLNNLLLYEVDIQKDIRLMLI
ncbi:MAG: GIY-YIG nuclease family protein [Bacteroidales bacterium]